MEEAMKNRIFSKNDGAYLPVGKQNGTMGLYNWSIFSILQAVTMLKAHLIVIAQKHTKNFSFNGCKVSKDEMHRVFLGLFKVTYRYNGQEFTMWTTGDGEEQIFDGIPLDQQRQDEIATKLSKLDAVPANLTWLVIFGLIAALISAGICGYNQFWIALGISAALAILFGALIPSIKRKGTA
jgi:hypothetical protein